MSKLIEELERLGNVPIKDGGLRDAIMLLAKEIEKKVGDKEDDVRLVIHDPLYYERQMREMNKKIDLYQNKNHWCFYFAITGWLLSIYLYIKVTFLL